MKTVTIIILNYNGWKDTIECLDSLRNTIYATDIDTHIVVVDNGSSNESVRMILDWISQSSIPFSMIPESDLKYNDEKIILLCADNNYGFAGGNNLGIRFAISLIKSDYVLLLNNDTTVGDGFLYPLVSLLNNNDAVGIVGSEIHDYYDKSRYSLGGYINLLKCSGYHNYDSEKLHLKEVTFLSGCIWLLRKEAIEKCGLLDEKFFLYLEDVDYCYRMASCGYKLTCTKDSVIYHKESRSTEHRPVIYYYNTRNRLYLSDKIHHHKYEKVLFFLYFLTTRIIRIVTNPKIAKYILLGFIDYKKGIFGKYNG